jgi:hypothetical protein
MASDEFIDNTIANLKIIGMVPQNGKLCVRKGQLCVETTDQMQPVRRWVRGDSRDLTLMHVRNTISNATRITYLLSADSDAGTNPKKWTISRIASDMSQCEVGLQNLRTTYAADSIMVANVGVIIERLAAHRDSLVGTTAELRPKDKDTNVITNVTDSADGKDSNSQDECNAVIEL